MSERASEHGADADADVEAVLVRRIREGDLSARIVYADWLEERGHLARATLLRHDNPTSAALDLVCWLHELVGPDDLGSFEVSPGYLAFGLTSAVPIPPGTGAVMAARPQVSPVVPLQIVVPESIADRFEIVNISVGRRGQLEIPGIPASLFTPSSIADHRCRISFDVVNVAQDFRIEVNNVSDMESVFCAIVFCQSCLDAPAAELGHGEISASEMADIVARMRAQIDRP